MWLLTQKKSVKYAKVICEQPQIGIQLSGNLSKIKENITFLYFLWFLKISLTSFLKISDDFPDNLPESQKVA